MAMFAEAVSIITNQDKIKYLKRFSLLDKEINRKLEEITYWRSRLEQITSTPSHTPKGGGSIHKFGDIIIKIINLEQGINADIDRLIEIKEDITKIIEQVEDDRERLLLQYRYLDGRTFEWIAGEMYYHWQWVHRLHQKALSSIQF